MKPINVILGLSLIILGSCKDLSSPTSSKKEKETPNTEQTCYEQSNNFVEALKSNRTLSSYFAESWSFVYHEDNRCDGQTDGNINSLNSEVIDAVIPIKVVNDGEGWACEKKEESSYILSFNLKEEIKLWDRIEVANYKNNESNKIYINGKGESDYLVVYFNANCKIHQLEYRSEDPG